MLFVQQLVKKRELEILAVSGHKNIADLGTKHHDKSRLDYLRKKLLLMTAAEFVEEFGSLISSFELVVETPPGAEAAHHNDNAFEIASVSLANPNDI